MNPLRILALNWRCLEHPQAGGSEINLFAQARHWVQEGHEVTVFCAQPDGAPLSRTAVVDGINVYRRGSRLTVYLWAAWFLLLNGRRFDRILDVANGIPFFAPLFSRTPSVLLIHHVHDRQWYSEFPAAIARVGRWIELEVVPWIYRRHSIIAVSPTTGDALVEIGVRPEQIEIVYNGVERPAELPQRRQRGGQHVVYVGRFKRYKRVHLLIHAIAELRAEFPDVQLDLVGDGDARPELEQLVADLGLADNVSFYGFVDERIKGRIMCSATVFATPSMHEGWGLSVIEANAFGCPAVAYNVPGLKVAIRDGETGLLAEDDAGFRDAIGALLRDPALRAQLSRQALEWATHFDWQVSAQKTLELLRNARRGSRPGGEPAWLAQRA